MNIELYHGSYESKLTIEDTGLFGGIFASHDKDVALSHGCNLHKITLDESEILTQYGFEYEINVETVKNIILESLNSINDEEFDDVWSVIVEDKSIFDTDIQDERIAEIFRCSDMGECGWEAQRIRGLIAKKLGYNAVEMNDEHGITYLVLPGVEAEVVENEK